MSHCTLHQHLCSIRSSIPWGRYSICSVDFPFHRCWDLKLWWQNECLISCLWVNMREFLWIYRDTEMLVRRHIAWGTPVRGRQAAYMDTFVQPFDTRSNTAVFECAFLVELFYAICKIKANSFLAMTRHDKFPPSYLFISFELSKLCVCLNIFCALLSILFSKFEFDSAASVSGRVTGSGSNLMSVRVAKYGINVLQTHRRYISCWKNIKKNNMRMNEMESPSINKNQLRLAIEPENNKLKRRPWTPPTLFFLSLRIRIK